MIFFSTLKRARERCALPVGVLGKQMRRAFF